MSKNIIPCYVEEVNKSIKSDREREILKLRSEGMTLTDIGDMYDITRERVRQLEMGPRNRIVNIFTLYKNNIKKDITQNGIVIKKKAVDCFGDDLWKIIKYSLFGHGADLVKSSESGWSFFDGLVKIVFCDNDYLIKVIKEISNHDIYVPESFNQKHKEIEKYTYEGWKNNDTLKIFKSLGFCLNKTYVYKNNLTLSDAIKFLGQTKEFESGINVDSSSESFKLLKIRLSEEFKVKSMSDNALRARICDVLYLWDDGKYVSEKHIRYNKKCIDCIEKFLKDHAGKQVLYKNIFTALKDDLVENSNVKTSKSLHGMMVYLVNVGILNVACGRHYASYKEKDLVNTKEHYKKIPEYLLSTKRPVSTNEVLKHFPLMAKEDIEYCKLYYPEIISYNRGSLININIIKYTNGEKDIILDVLNRIAARPFAYVNGNELFYEMQLNHPNVVKKSQAKNARSFCRSIEKILDENEYQLTFPHLLKGYNKRSTAKDNIVLNIIRDNKISEEELFPIIDKIYWTEHMKATTIYNKLKKDYNILEQNGFLKIEDQEAKN